MSQLAPPPLRARIDRRVEPGSATAVRVRSGELIEIEDLEGCQVADVLAFRAERPQVGIGTAATRAVCDGLFPLVGQPVVDPGGGRLLTLVHDDVGRHDTFGVACNRAYYAAHGQPEHLNCTDAFNRELPPLGVAARPFWEPVNVFYNTTIGADGRIVEIHPSRSRPGDRFVLRAEADLVVAASACPDDISATNGFHPTPIAFRVGSAQDRQDGAAPPA